MTLRIIREEALSVRPDAVLFDLDNTLYDYAPANRRGIEAVRAKIGHALNVTPDAFRDAFAAAQASVKQLLGHTAASHSRLLYFQRTIEILGFRTQPLLALDLEQTFWRTFLSTAQLLPGVEDVLIELRASGIPLGLVTDLTAQIQFRKLIHFGIERYFDVVVTSEEAGVEKIGLLPFHLAMDKLELDRAARVWMIGDAQVDIQQGKQALNCCTFQRCEALSRATIYPEADVVFDSFSDLLTMLQTLGHPPGHPKS